jgi:hypothetical protein
LAQYTFTDKEFVQVTEEFSLKHEAELVNHSGIRLTEYPTVVHEYMNRRMDRVG